MVDETGFPSRGFDRAAHSQYVSRLLTELSRLEAASAPNHDKTKAAGQKDNLAYLALNLAGDLVRAVAGWALDHKMGTAMAGLERVAKRIEAGPISTDRYEQMRASVGDHAHETVGGKATEEGMPLAPDVGRHLLVGLLEANPGGFPPVLAEMAVEALRAVNAGYLPPLFQTPPDAKYARTAKRSDFARLRDLALAFVEYRVHAYGMKKGAAREQVGDKCGVSADTLKTWASRKPIGASELRRSNLIGAAINAASFTASAIQAGAQADHEKVLYTQAEASWGNDALTRLGEEFEAEHARIKAEC